MGLRFVNKAFNLEIELGEQERVYKTREGKEINMGYKSELTAKIKIQGSEEKGEMSKN